MVSVFSRRTVCANLLAAPFALASCSRFKSPKDLSQPDAQLWDPPVGVRAEESFAHGPNGAVYVRAFGSGRTPVVILHGGPAGAHGYLLPYAHLADQRRVIFYDQSGCGRSASPKDLRLYTAERYADELEAVRDHIGVQRMILIGHSWGGMLAQIYVGRHPDRVAGLMLSGTVARWSDFALAAEIWLRELGADAVATVRRAEARGSTDDPAYGRLLERYYGLHLCRLKQWPPFLQEAGQAISQNPVYLHLNGPSEFQFTGTLRSLDTSEIARSIRVPTLVACGEFDEAAPTVARHLAGLIPGSRYSVFRNLSHMHHIEDPARVVRAARALCDSVAD